MVHSLILFGKFFAWCCFDNTNRFRITNHLKFLVSEGKFSCNCVFHCWILSTLDKTWRARHKERLICKRLLDEQRFYDKIFFLSRDCDAYFAVRSIDESNFVVLFCVNEQNNVCFSTLLSMEKKDFNNNNNRNSISIRKKKTLCDVWNLFGFQILHTHVDVELPVVLV